MWHASISRRAQLGPFPLTIEDWSRSEREAARARLLKLLDGVGSGETIVAMVDDPFHYALHVKRVLNEAEKATLDPAWCAIEPRDPAGDIVLERIEARP